MNANQITREQILDALQTHKSVNNAAKALGINYPTMQKLLKRHGIVTNHTKKEETPESEAEAKAMDEAEKDNRKKKRQKIAGIVGMVVTVLLFVGCAVLSFFERNTMAGLAWINTSLIAASSFAMMNMHENLEETYSKFIKLLYKRIGYHMEALQSFRDEAYRIADDVRPSIRGKFIKELGDKINALVKEEQNEIEC